MNQSSSINITKVNRDIWGTAQIVAVCLVEIIIVGLSVPIIIYYCCNRHTVRKTSYFFLQILLINVAYMLLLLSNIVRIVIFWNVGHERNDVHCVITYCMLDCLRAAALANAVTITIEKLWVVMYPYKYHRRKIIFRDFLIISMLIWAVCLLLSFFQAIQLEEGTFTVFRYSCYGKFQITTISTLFHIAEFVVCCIGLLIIYFKLHLIMHQSNRRHLGIPASTPLKETPSTNSIKMARLSKATLQSIYVTCVLVVLWTPLLLVYLFFWICGAATSASVAEFAKNKRCMKLSHNNLMSMKHIADGFSSLQICLNTILFVWTNRTLRIQLIMFYKCRQWDDFQMNTFKTLSTGAIESHSSAKASTCSISIRENSRLNEKSSIDNIASVCRITSSSELENIPSLSEESFSFY